MVHQKSGPRSWPSENLSVAWGLVMIAVLTAGSATAQQSGQKTFKSAGEAAKALVSAVKAEDQAQLLEILGPGAKDIISSGDPADDKNHREEFVQKYKQMHRLVTEPDGATTLYIGAENWPTPIPLAHKGSAWYFDTPKGRQQILYRRIGRNELAAIQVCRELADAQNEYQAQPHDGDDDRQYAQKLFSDPGKQDGLYWPVSSGQAESPIGPLLASANADGHGPEGKPEPFQGYYFRILKAQGPNVPGGAHSYVENGKMTRGFAFLAFPAEYRNSGVMTFIVDKSGVVYEKDLGPQTAETAKTLTRYNRDATWRKAD